MLVLVPPRIESSTRVATPLMALPPFSYRCISLALRCASRATFPMERVASPKPPLLCVAVCTAATAAAMARSGPPRMHPRPPKKAAAPRAKVFFSSTSSPSVYGSSSTVSTVAASTTRRLPSSVRTGWYSAGTFVVAIIVDVMALPFLLMSLCRLLLNTSLASSTLHSSTLHYFFFD